MRLSTVAACLLSAAGAFAEPGAPTTSLATFTSTRTVYMVTTQTKTGTPPAYNSTASGTATGSYAAYGIGNATLSGAASPATSSTTHHPTASFTGAAVRNAGPVVVAVAGAVMALAL